MQLVPRCISTIAMQLRPSFVIEERFHSFRRRRVEREDLSQETLPTGVVRKIVIGVLLPFAYYLHTPWSNQFLGHENGKQFKSLQSNNSFHKLDLSGSTGPVGTAAPLTPPPPTPPPPLPSALALIRTFLHFNCRLQGSTTHDTTGLIRGIFASNL